MKKHNNRYLINIYERYNYLKKINKNGSGKLKRIIVIN